MLVRIKILASKIIVQHLKEVIMRDVFMTTRPQQLLYTILSIFITTFICSCVPYLGPTIEAPELTTTTSSNNSDRATSTRRARARLSSSISIQKVADARHTPTYQEHLEENNPEHITPEYTQPVGPITSLVESALRDSLKNAGVGILDSAPISLKAEVREWKAKISSRFSSDLQSYATLYIELLDPAGKRIYSGTYQGERSSKFPFINRSDVKDSLATAMHNCIANLLADEQLLELIGSY